MLWPMWVVLIAGSTGSALVLFALPTVTSRRISDVISLRRKRDGFLVAFALGHHGPSYPRDLVGKRDGGDLRRSPRQQCREPGPMLGAMDFGLADHGEGADREQAAQIAIASFADIAEAFLASARVLLWDEPDPGRKISA